MPGHVSLVRSIGRAFFAVLLLAALSLTATVSASATPAANAIHPLMWSDRVVSDTSGALMPQDSSMPCTECHDMGNPENTSIHSFSTARTDGVAITVVRELCEGCHHPYDAPGDPVVVQGLVLRPLSGGPLEHGDADTTPCSDCHGSSGHKPVGHGAGGSGCADAGCHDSDSHPIHLSSTDARGPGRRSCTECHESGNIPYFATGTDTDLSGHIELDETTVCDACHSPGGSYDGVDTTVAPSGALSVGARDNWTSGVYADAANLQAGKERWCVGCHDGDESAGIQAASVIDDVYAPPVAGDESGAYTYGIGWGYYETGHGTPSSTVLPSNGYDTGPGIDCDECHDYAAGHIDGDRRTYSREGASTDYRTGYRLDLVDGEEPMLVPWTTEPNSADNYRLCTQSGCHDPYPFVTQAADGTSTPSARRTNFWNDIGWHGWYNYHVYHLALNSHQGPNRWAPDWGDTLTSRIQCVTCHNVHGSTRMAMIHDGSLISDTVDRVPGMSIFYLNDEISVWGGIGEPDPAEVTLAMSDAIVFKNGSAWTVCSGCHGGGYGRRPRVLWQDYGLQPVLDWTGETNYQTDGSSPDTATVEEARFFRVEYTDKNNDAPSFVTLRIDRNDDGDCDDTSETVTMEKEQFLDATYYTGVVYKTSLSLAKAGDNEIVYHFEASDGVFPTTMSETRTVNVVNAAPELPWTGETGYGNDGVAPNGGTSNDTDYEFRITYKDPDGEAPAGGSPLLYVDADDDGEFEGGESVTMTPMAGGDYISGKRYTVTFKIPRLADDTFLYRFEASDGFDGAQTATRTVYVRDGSAVAPELTWTGEADYSADGVDPQIQAGGKPFYFRVEYTDANNEAPSTAQVWVDKNDDGVYGAGEKYPMDDLVSAGDPDATDGDYTNGEVFAEKVYVPYAADGTLTYCFHFKDSASTPETATGTPEFDGVPGDDSSLGVFDALDVPSEFATIQSAIDTATTGATVLVADGTYGNISLDGKDITIDSVNGAASTSIVGTGTLVSFETTDSNSTLRGFTISNGTTGVVVGASGVTIQECVVKDNSGAGIQYDGPQGDYLVVEDSTISGNHPGVLSTQANYAIFRRTDVTGNSVAGDGAGIDMAGTGYVHSPRWTFEGCTFSDNIAGGSGGAFYQTGATSNIGIYDCIFENNRAEGGDGGALASVVTPNEAGTVERTIFRGNYASGDGGALRRNGGQSPFARWNFTNTIFSGNYAGGNGGADYRLTIASGTTFRNCTFSGNSAERGGGVFLQNSFFNRLKILDCIMYGDESRSNPDRNEFDIEPSSHYSKIGIEYTNVYQSTFGFTYAKENFTADPMFVDPVAASSAPTSTGDYHIQVGSPCEGSADPSSTVTEDIDAETRPQGSARRDSGADEIGAVAAIRLVPAEHTLPASELATEPTDPHVLPGALTPLGLSKSLSVPLTNIAERLSRSIDLETEASLPGSKGGSSSTSGESDPLPALPAATVGAASLLVLAWKAIVRFLASLS